MNKWFTATTSAVCTAVKMYIPVFWVVRFCQFVHICHCFRAVYGRTEVYTSKSSFPIFMNVFSLLAYSSTLKTGVPSSSPTLEPNLQRWWYVFYFPQQLSLQAPFSCFFFKPGMLHVEGCDSSVNKVTHYGHIPGIKSWWRRDFPHPSNRP
jgi:hypothetical protein